MKTTAVTTVTLVDPVTEEELEVQGLAAGSEITVSIEIPQELQALSEDPAKDHCDVGSFGLAPRQCYGRGMCVFKQCWCQLPYTGDQCNEQPECAFWDESSSAWSDVGLTDLGDEQGYLLCKTTHLTDFAGKQVVVPDRSPPPAEPAPPPPVAPDDDGLPIAIIAGAAGGGGAVICCLLVVIIIMLTRKKGSSKVAPSNSVPVPQP